MAKSLDGFTQRLPAGFFQRDDVLRVARDLLGMVLVSRVDGLFTAGRITEVEAYRAPDDKACHAWNNRRTARTEAMFRSGGCAYIYLCYGIHHLFNVVTGPEGMAHAVLIRGFEPVEGVEHMWARRYRSAYAGQACPVSMTTGPGAVGQAMGFRSAMSGMRFDSAEALFWIEDLGMGVGDADVVRGKRIGVGYAGECADWDWRFWIEGARYVKKEPFSVR